jgi:hypothetical protein
MMANLNSVPSERSPHIWQDEERPFGDPPRSAVDASDPATLFDSLLTADDRKFLWAMWIDFRHSPTETT